MPRSRSDYYPELVEASLSVLIELMTVLKSYKKALVLIGGWAPYFILQQYQELDVEFRHVGSIDIDLVIDPEMVGDEEYATITRMLLERGYKPSPKILYQFERTIIGVRDGREYTVGVDFLTPRPPKGSGRTHRHRPVQPDLKARTLEGAEIALAHNSLLELSGRLPGDGLTEVSFKVADLVACLALKGFALGERYREKDAYDIYTLCAYYRGGPKAVADQLKPYLEDPLPQRGLAAIATRFKSPDGDGPSWVANFLGYDDRDQELRTKQDAFMTVGEVLRLLGGA
jgi:hypothetical protein